MANWWYLISDVALAQGESAAAQPSIMEMLAMPLGMVFIMYFLIIRPQQKKHKEHQSLLEQLKVGDEVVTSGGIIGKIKSVADSFVTVEIANNTIVKVLKAHISASNKQTPKPAKT